MSAAQQRTILALHTTSALALCLAHGLMFFVAVYPLLTVPAVLGAVIGVETFLVVSGYLLGCAVRELARDGAPVGQFLFLNGSQTLPRYFLFYAINLSLLYALTPSSVLPQLSFLWLGSYLFSPPHSRFFPESWVLAVEFWFVMLIGLTAAVLSKMHLHPMRRERLLYSALVAIVVLSPLARAWFTVQNGWTIDEGIRKLTLFRFDALAIGVIAAREFSRISPIRAVRSMGGLLALSGALYIALLSVRDSSVGGPVLLEPATSLLEAFAASFALSLVTLGCAIFVAALERQSAGTYTSSIISRTLGGPFFAHSILLCHLPLLLVAHYFFPSLHTASPPTQLLAMLAWFCLTIGAAVVCCRVFESPLARWGELLRQRTT